MATKHKNPKTPQNSRPRSISYARALQFVRDYKDEILAEEIRGRSPDEAVETVWLRHQDGGIQ